MNLRLSKNIVQNISLVLCFFLFFSATPTMWPQQFALNTNATGIATQFQLLNGSNRIAEAKELLSLVTCNKLLINRDNQIPISNTLLLKTNYSLADFHKIFGNPSKVNKDGSLTYIYDYTTCKSFTININKNGVQIIVSN